MTGVSARGRRRIPDPWVLTHDGRRVRFYRDLVRDRTVLVAFMYTRCNGVCPATSGTMARLQARLHQRMGRELLFLSITLDPQHDDPVALRVYARSLAAGPGWLFLTGEPAAIEDIRRSLGVRDLDPEVDLDPSQHASILTFGNDRTGRWAALPSLLRVEYLAAAILRVMGPATVRA
jgi:protein SCO1